MRLIENSRTKNLFESIRDYSNTVEIGTGLSSSDKKAVDILNGVIGQMSDGIWENSPGYDKYWKNIDIETDEDGIYIIANLGYGSPFRDKDPEAIKRFMANKVKQIVKTEAEYERDIQWSRSCESPVSYLNYSAGVTVRDCYRVYDKLLGRIDRITEGSIIEKNSDDFENIVVRDFQIFIEDKYNIETEEELQERLSKITEDDVNEYFTGMFYDIVDTDDLDSANEAEQIIRTKYNLLDNLTESTEPERKERVILQDISSKFKEITGKNISKNDIYVSCDDGSYSLCSRRHNLAIWTKEEDNPYIKALNSIGAKNIKSNKLGNLTFNLTESAKSKKEKKPEERVIMQQGNVTCLKKDNKFKVFEDTDTNLAEYDSQEEAMRDALNRCGVNPDNELSEEKDNLKESAQYQVVKTLEVGPSNYKSEVHGTYDTYEQAEDICGELNAQGIRATVKETSDIDEGLKALLLKKEELYNDESIDDDDYYHQVDIIDNIIVNNYSLEEIDEAMKALGIDDSE